MSFETYLAIECHLSTLTIQAYKSDIEHFYSITNVKYPQKQHITLFLNQLNNEQFTKSSIARKMSALRLYLTYLSVKKNKDVPDVKDMFTSNLALKLPKLIAKADLEKVLSYSFKTTKNSKRNDLIVALLYYCGCRVSEVANLKRKCVFNEHIIITGKGNKQRLIPIAEVVKQKLKAYLTSQEFEQGADYLFMGAKNNPITRQTISNILSDLKKACGIKGRLSPHTMRHMFASFLLEQGMDIREVQLLLGHASIKTTEIYTHLDKTKLKRTFIKYHPLS
ncbi:MAG: tyrosine-type recombinase/integrase [Candidatus Marinamargulisbacteria bacterium]